MAILYTATRPADFEWSASYLTSYKITTNTSKIDSSYVTHGLDASDGSVLNARANHGEPSGNTLWFHFDFRYNSPNTPDDGSLLVIYDSLNKPVFYIDAVNGNLYAYVYGDATSASTNINNIRTSRMDYDISITVDGVNTTAKIYQRNQLIYEFSTPNAGTVEKPAYTIIQMSDIGYSGGTSISQMIWADENTRGMKMAEIPMDSLGIQTYSDWTGQVDNLFNNNDELYIISNNAPGNKFTSTLATFNGETVGYEIKTVRMSSRAWKSLDSTITNFKHITRVGTTDYDSLTLHATNDQTRNNFQTDFPVNPATTVGWTFGEVAVAEFGVKTEL